MGTDATGLTVLADQATDIALYRPPEAVLEEARKAAVALEDVIKKKKDPVIMNGQQYLEYEDWQTVGRFYGISAKVVATEFVTYGAVRGFSAKAVALRADGAEISAAEADCLSDEPKWSKKAKYEWRDKDGGGRERVQVGEEDVPLFQLKSMAQTRACAKALRNVLAWVVVLAGYRATPAEELERDDHGGKAAGSGRSEGAQASTQAASSSGKPSGQPEGATRIKSVTTKSGENARGPWTSYRIHFEDGRQANTFSATDGKHAQNAEKSAALVIPRIKKTDKGFNLEGFEPWPKKEEKKEEHPNAEHDEPVNGPEKILITREINTDAGKRWAIQTDKRIIMTDKIQHVEDANEARKEQMKLTPRIEVVQGKNRLLAWEETEAMHAAEGPHEKPAEEPPAEQKKTTRRKKADAK